MPDSVCPVGALLLRDGEIHREDHRRRRVDGHRRRDIAERNPVEQPFHVGERHDADTAFPDLAKRQRVVRIAAHERWQIEGDAQTGAARGEQGPVSLVGLLRRPKTGKLPHRPELAAIARRVDAAGVRETPPVRSDHADSRNPGGRRACKGDRSVDRKWL